MAVALELAGMKGLVWEDFMEKLFTGFSHLGDRGHEERKVSGMTPVFLEWMTKWMAAQSW